MREQPRVYYKDKQEYKEVSAKDLTRSQLLRYIFDDFFRVSYIVLMFFIDVIIIAQFFYFIPGFQNDLTLISAVYNGRNLLEYYTVIMILFVESVCIYYQAILFRKIWPRKPLDTE